MSQKPITIKDLAEQLNISVSTVSRALKDNHEISEKTRKAVQDLAKKVGYKPNPIAVALKTHKSYTIGVIVPQIVSTFFATVVKTIEEVADKYGYNVLVSSSNESFEKEMKSIDILLGTRADGIILSLAHETRTFDHIKNIQEAGIPVVLFDRTTDKFEISRVVTDGLTAAFQAVQHLVEVGAKKIFILTGPKQITIGGNRMKGYLKAMESNHLEVKPHYVCYCEDYTVQAGKKAVQQIIAAKDIPEAIFGINDDLIIGAIEALKEAGLRIPEDVALVGFSNTKRSRYMSPTVSSINQFPEKIGKIAAELLFEQILNNRHAKIREEIVNCELIVRDSSNRKRQILHNN
ncbi:MULTISPECIES: LacI family DNA-binding transcriptional regulator [Porphyromonadaceae]|uniref:LacI family transcriptional regulator n=1 Tax=Sanguibacteroides justesenii TaxID=1547597 RepID=A0AB34R5B4_9PORP|nr:MULTISPECIES: LacI family DNA-binding transcriptional regulator [Porphyromonadaceae]KIO47071.1 LacI family transcriptional regulator [Sanguibacteroides justesenii]